MSVLATLLAAVLVLPTNALIVLAVLVVIIGLPVGMALLTSSGGEGERDEP